MITAPRLDQLAFFALWSAGREFIGLDEAGLADLQDGVFVAAFLRACLTPEDGETNCDSTVLALTWRIRARTCPRGLPLAAFCGRRWGCSSVG